MLTQDLYYIATLPLRIFKELTFDVYMLSDKARIITYVTSTSVGIDRYIVERLCGDDVTITKVKRIYAWELKKFANSQNAVMIDMHKYFARFFGDGFLVPEYIRQSLDIDKSVDDVIKISNNELKKVDKYSYEISNDPDALKFFYEKMYVPYIKKRHGDLVHIESFNNVEKIFKNGELIFITLDGEYVSAALCEINDNVYFYRKNGILNEDSLKEGALVATYYFSILRAKEINKKIVDLGLSRPFLLDGVLRHKRLWGARIFEAKTIQRIIYLKNVLFKQPFIYVENKKLKAAIFSENDKLANEYANSGLELNVIPQKNDEQRESGSVLEKVC